MSEARDSYECMREMMEFPQKSRGEGVICLGQYKVTAWNPDSGQIFHQYQDKNVITKLGKATMLSLLFGLTLGSSMVALAVGNGSTAATSSDTRLTNELVGNGASTLNRIPLGGVTSTAGSFVALTNSDIVDDVQVIGSNTYEKSLTTRGIFPKVDGNNESNFREFALMSTLLLPATGTTQSGWLYNHFVLPADIPKTVDIEVDCDIKILF